MLIKKVQSDRCANSRIHNPLVAGPKLKTIEKTPDDPWAGASLPAAAAAPSMSADPWSGWKPQGGKPATAVGGPKNPQKIDAPIAAKFQSVEERLSIFEATKISSSWVTLFSNKVSSIRPN